MKEPALGGLATTEAVGRRGRRHPQDGGTLRLRPPARGGRGRRARVPRRASRSAASTCASTASAPSTTRSRDRCSTRTGSRRGASGGLARRSHRRDRELRAPARSRGWPRPRSRSPTSSRAAGIGTRLLEQLAARAAATGIERFVAEVMAENRAMLSVFAGAGLRGRARARARRGRGQLPDRGDRGASRSASRSATTSRSPPRCARSSSRRAWP